MTNGGIVLFMAIKVCGLVVCIFQVYVHGKNGNI